MTTLWSDLRYAARSLRKAPAFTLIDLVPACTGDVAAGFTVAQLQFSQPLISASL